MIRCPCRNCLVKPTCKESCDRFDKFIRPIDKVSDILENFFGALDELIEATGRKWMSGVFDLIGEFIIVPCIIYPFVWITRADFKKEELTAFDDRYEDWRRKNNKDGF